MTDVGRINFGEPEHVGEKHSFYKVPGHPEMVIQCRAELPDSAAWFEVACGVYELWLQAGLPVRYLHRFHGPELRLAFVGREVKAVELKLQLGWRLAPDGRRAEAELLDEEGNILAPDLVNGWLLRLDRQNSRELGRLSWDSLELGQQPNPLAKLVLISRMGIIGSQAFEVLSLALEKEGIQAARLILEFGIDADNGELLIATSVDGDWLTAYPADAATGAGTPEAWPRFLAAAAGRMRTAVPS